MKRILIILCTMALAMTCAVPALAAAENPSAFYPVEVEEYMEGESPRIRKVYQLALSDDPAQIPTEDFERDGRLYFLLDMTREDSVGVVTRPHIETITAKSDTDDIQKVLAQLDAEIDVATEDAYTGTLRLDHTSVKVAADGYATKTKALAATRTYPNLSEADVSLIPKTIQENGKTLELADVQWDSCPADGGGRHRDPLLRHRQLYRLQQLSVCHRLYCHRQLQWDGGPDRLRNCDLHRHLWQYAAPEGDSAGEVTDTATTAKPMDTTPLVIGAVVLAIAVGGVFGVKKLKERR